MYSPKFSIIVPVYNKAEYINRSVSSLLEQVYTDFEIIIVVDRSSDRSLELVQSFDDNRITVLTREEPGPGGYAARNLGIQSSRGEWITFLDADDVWKADHLLCLNREISANPPDIDMIVMGYETDEGRICSLDFGDRILSQVDMLELFAQRDFIHTNCFAVKRDHMVNVGMFPAGRARQGGDADTWLRLILHCRQFRVCKDVTSYYYSLDGGVISTGKNMQGAHPILATVDRALHTYNDSSSRKYRLLLKRIANRKSISWMIHRKTRGYFRLVEVHNLYLIWPGIRQFGKVILLMLPKRIVSGIIGVAPRA